MDYVKFVFRLAVGCPNLNYVTTYEGEGEESRQFSLIEIKGFYKSLPVTHRLIFIRVV
jgi:hypothetical protein